MFAEIYFEFIHMPETVRMGSFMRLVLNQDPRRNPQALHQVSEKLTPKGIERNIRVYSKGPACVVGTDNGFVEAAHEVFQKDSGFTSSGGSIPIVTDFQDVLRIPSVMTDFGLPDDNLYGPMRSYTSRIFIAGSSRSLGFSRNWEVFTVCEFF